MSQYQPILVQSTALPVRTLLEQSTVDHPITLQSSGQIVSQILQTTQGSPTRSSNTFVYRSESPIRNSMYGRNVVNVSTIQRNEAPMFISRSSTQNPIYVEKIVKVESSSTQELSILRQRIQVLEQNNRSLTEELIELRGATPQQVEQIVYIQDNEELNRLQDENEGVKRSKRDADNTNAMLMKEIERLNLQVRDLSLQVTEFQQIVPARDGQIRALQAQNEALAIRFVLATAELERLVRERIEVVPLQRKISDLENYVSIQDRTIEDLRNKLLHQEQLISQLRLIELKSGQQEQEINGLRSRVEDLLRMIQQLQATINQKDQDISKLNLTINELTVISMQFQQMTQEFDALRQAYALRLKEIEELRQRCAEFDLLLLKIKQLEAKLAEAEKNNQMLLYKIGELSGDLNDESVKRSKREGDLEISLRDKQSLEEKLVHFTQQIEFMGRKIQAQEQEISAQRQRIAELEGIARQVEGLNLKVSSLQQQIERLMQIIAEKDQQISNLMQENSQLRQQANLVPGLQGEILRLLEVIVVRTVEVEELRNRVVEFEKLVAQLQVYVTRCSEYENIINMLRQRIQELESNLNDENVKRSKKEGELSLNLRDKQALEEKLVHLTQQLDFLQMKIQNYEKQLAERDQIISQLKQDISQHQITIIQLQGQGDELKRVVSMLEQKLQECEQNNALLRQRIAELEAMLNDENIKRTRKEGELNLNQREKQALEEKLVHLTQQLEFLSRKLSIVEQENLNLRQVVISTSQLLEEWSRIQQFHGQFQLNIESILVEIKKVSQFSSSSTVVTSQQVVRRN